MRVTCRAGDLDSRFHLLVQAHGTYLQAGVVERAGEVKRPLFDRQALRVCLVGAADDEDLPFGGQWRVRSAHQRELAAELRVDTAALDREIGAKVELEVDFGADDPLSERLALLASVEHHYVVAQLRHRLIAQLDASLVRFELAVHVDASTVESSRHRRRSRSAGHRGG